MKRQKERPATKTTEAPGSSAGRAGTGGGERAKEWSVAGFPPASWRQDWLLGFLLAALTIMAYQPAWHAGLIWDDDKHITQPELRSLHGLARIWTQLGATQQYYPLVHSVFWAEHKLWGDAATGYHWLNILLHAFSAVLLARILSQLKIPGAWLAAALFAVHPVEVESVAWISELKNTLSGVFYLGAALAYLRFDRSRSGRDYAMALGLFLLGLMSKTVIASLPAALLVVFWWQRGKVPWKRDALPLIPFFIAGIGAGLLTAWVERRFIGAEGSEFNFSIIERILIAGRDVWFYLGKLFWPVDLAFIYPRWNVSQAVWWQYLYPAAGLVLLGVLVWRRWRGPLAALLFFVGTLFPALGFFNVYPFRYSLVADHFQYLASVGPLTLAAAGIAAVPGFFRQRKPWLEAMFCAALLLALGTLTWRQCGMYANAETLWQTTLRLHPDSWMAHDNLGNIYDQEGRMDEAIAQYEKSLECKPDDAVAYNDLGFTYFQQGRKDEAIAAYQKALKIKPDYAEAHYNLGVAFQQQGRKDEAISEYEKVLKIKPDEAAVRMNLGVAFVQEGRLDEAIAQYQKALETRPEDAEARNNLGLAFFQEGRLDEAIAQFQEAVGIKPELAGAHENLGMALLRKRSAADAIFHLQKALEIKPTNPVVQNKLAWLLATSAEASLRNGPRAVELALQANALTGGKDPAILETVAAAWAEAGQFDDATRSAQQAMELARAAGQQDLAGKLKGELKGYQAGQPFHQ